MKESGSPCSCLRAAVCKLLLNQRLGRCLGKAGQSLPHLFHTCRRQEAPEVSHPEQEDLVKNLDDRAPLMVSESLSRA